MRLAGWPFALLVAAVLAAPAHAQVSCADPNNLCTGDPCTMVTTQVQSPCVVDFGSRTLVIGGVLDVPDGGTLSFTAATIRLLGRIDGRHVGNGTGTGAQVELIATTGDADLRGEIDVSGTVAAGTIHVDAGGNVDVKDRLNAKPAGSNITASGGSIDLEADGTLTTDQTAVVDAQGLAGDTAGGSIVLRGAAGVLIKGRVRTEGTPSGTIEVSSSAGTVTLEKDLRVPSEAGAAGSVLVSGQTGVVVADKIRARGGTTGGSVTLTSAAGDVSIEDLVRASGNNSAGTIDVSAPLGTVSVLAPLDVRGGVDGGSIAVSGATVTLRGNVLVEGKNGNGGNASLSTTGLLNLNHGDVKARGKVNGGAISLLGDAASGDISVVKASFLDARGGLGNGGTLTVSAPAGAVSIATKVTLNGHGNGGQAHVDAAALTVGPNARFDADGGTGGAELRFSQSGAGVMLLNGTFEARASGVIEGLAPAGDLTALGRFRAAPAGCIGLSAGGTLDTSAAVLDVSLAASCP